jgi:hypothetical protein
MELTEMEMGGDGGDGGVGGGGGGAGAGGAGGVGGSAVRLCLDEAVGGSPSQSAAV